MRLDLETRKRLINFASIFLPSLIIAMMLFSFLLGFSSSIMKGLNWYTLLSTYLFLLGGIFELTLGKNFGFWAVVITGLSFILFLFFMIQILLRSPIKIFLATFTGFIPVGILLFFYLKDCKIEFAEMGALFFPVGLGLSIGLPPVVIILLITYIWKFENLQLKIFRIPLLLISLLPFIFTAINFLMSIRLL